MRGTTDPPVLDMSATENGSQLPATPLADAPRPHTSRRGRKLLSGCLALFLAAAIGVAYMLWTLKQVPEFYQQAAAQVADPFAREVAAVEFEQKLEHLKLDVEESTEWSETFSQQQINSWLATESESNPDLLPDGVSQPLIVIGEKHFQLGVAVNWEGWSGIISLDGAVHVHGPRTLRFRVIEVRLGGLEISLEEVRNRLKPQIEAIDSPNYRAVWIDDPEGPLVEVVLTDDEAAPFELTEIRLSPEQFEVSGASR